jgi:NodT family efflux transporter outer membrane factor (OMF) lipoprotein
MVIRTAVLGSVSRAGVLGLATLSVGCAAVGPDFQKPEVETAEAWLQAEDERVDSSRAEYEDWWKVFEDPALDRLIDHAYNENLGLQVAGLRILEARAQLGFATGLKYPQSQSVGTSYVRSKSSENAPPFSNLPDDVRDRINTSVNVWSTSFDIAWEADVWGKFRRGVEAADANLAANMLNYDAVLVSLTGDVAMTYATIRTLEQRLAYVRKNVALQEQGLVIAETRFEFGATSELDVQQSRGLLESTRALIPMLQIQIGRTRNVLSLLLGMPPSELTVLLGGPGDIPNAPTTAAVGIPADLIRRRPDVRAAEMAAAAQSAAIGVSAAELYPQFVLAGSIGLSGESFSDQFKSGSGSGFITPLINCNIFNYGRIKNNVRVQDARFQQLVTVYENVVLNAAREVEDGLVGFLRGQEEIANLENAVVASQRSVELSLDQYESGQTDFQRVLNSQAALLGQQDSLADARGRVLNSLVSIYRALGGGWQLREGNGYVDPDTLNEMRERTNWGELLDN